ncbi:MAG: GMC family oxidoreductase N-terminal domain-containing protein, partial [Actinomycetes bacterium]
DDWEAQGNQGWGYDEVQAYFARAEHGARSGRSADNGGGQVHVVALRSPSPLTTAFVQACIDTGMAACPDLNGPEPDGVGVVPVTSGGDCAGARPTGTCARHSSAGT